MMKSIEATRSDHRHPGGAWLRRVARLRLVELPAHHAGQHDEPARRLPRRGRLAARRRGRGPRPPAPVAQPDCVDPSAGVKGLIKEQLDQFGIVFSPDLRAQIAKPATGRPAESIENIVILASMVEREANKDSDRGNVCSVYYNRLASNTPLGVDATLLYYLGRLTPEPTSPEVP